MIADRVSDRAITSPPIRSSGLAVGILAGCILAVLLAGCGGDASPATTETPEPATETAAPSPTLPPLASVTPVSAAPAAIPAVNEAPATAATPIPVSNDSPPPTPVQAPDAAPPPLPTPAPAVKTYSAAQAQAQINGASLTPADLPPGWKVQSDVAAAPDADAISCGWLTGRTVANLPDDPVTAFLAAKTLSFFSNAAAYATAAGATDCAARAVAKLKSPADIARAFGTLFVDPNAVTGALFPYPQVADGSFAGTLTGKVNAAGTTIDLTVLIVAFRKGNVTAVIGSARSGATPPADELTPLIDLVVSRITANQ